MKNLVFKSVKIQNFLSIGEEPLIINFEKGITVITGENKDKGGKNGIGKSTITDAIFWCLFGNTIRDLKKDKIQHNKNDKECSVVLTFSIKTEKEEINYVLTRWLDPSKVELLCEGGQRYHDLTLSTIPKTDELIKQLIGANEEVFNNAVIMSANNTLPFMAQKKTEKRKFIEGVFQLNVFGEMLLKARSVFNEKKKENDLLSKDFINEQKTLLIHQKNKSDFEDRKNKRIKEEETKIETTKKELEKLKDLEIEDSTKINSDLVVLNEKLDKLRNGLTVNNQKIVDTNKKRTEEQTKKDQKVKEKSKLVESTACPTCKREYCTDDKAQIEENIKNLTSEIEQHESAIIKLDEIQSGNQFLGKNIIDGIEKIESKKKLLSDKLLVASTNNQKIENFNLKIKEYTENIESIKNETGNHDIDIETTNKNISDMEKSLNLVKKELSVLESVKFIVSEEGVKTYIVKKMLDVLNNRLNFYLKTLDAPCKCIFDETFEETIYNDQGKECSYFNFSGGERKRIDTAILFMFQDVLRFHSGTSFSLNMYDELFDSALDDKGIEKILDILKNKVEKYDESVYIISHKNNTKTNIDNVIFLQKENGVTKIINQ